MQIQLPETELRRLSTRIQEDYDAAIADHEARMDRFRRYYRKWRNRLSEEEAGDGTTPNFSVPLIQWNVLGKLASEVEALLGDDAEIIAKPVGPTDQRLVRKVGRYETWRVFQAMKLANPFTVFAFRKILFGRSHAYSPYVRDTYPVRKGGRVVEEVSYEGPGFFPMWPDDLIVPGEDAETIHDFSYVMRRYRTTPDRMLRSEGAGLYQGVADRFQELVDFANNDQRQRDWMGEEVKREKDAAEGVIYESGLSARGSLIVLEWYGTWRKLRGRRDAREDNLKYRDPFETELVLRYVPELDWIVGVQDLMDHYPRMQHRRPFVEASLIKDGSYWGPGFGELLESIEDEATVNHRLFTQAGRLTAGPVIFYKPASGFDPENFEYEPGTAYASEDPAGVRVVQIQADLQYPIVKEQTIIGYGERVTRQTDLTLGRSQDRPNAPKTARGTIALLEQGNIGAALDTRVFREDMGVVVSHFWQLEQQLPDTAQQTFFRVTEEQAGGLFDVKDGFGEMTAVEFGGKFDFDLKFATSVLSREAERERTVALYQIDLTNPLILNNPRALWLITDRVHKAMGDDNFADLVPQPPDLGLPTNPREEWTLALQGEEFAVHSMDDDNLHLADHYARLEQERRAPRPDEGAIEAMIAHIMAHQQQQRQKMLMQALTAQLTASLAQNTATGGAGLNAGGGPPLSLTQLRGVLDQLVQPPEAATLPGRENTQ